MIRTHRTNQNPSGVEEHDPLPDLLTFFKALAEPARLAVAGAIAARPLTAAEVGEHTGLGTRAALKHLKRLEEAQLAAIEGHGASARYHLRDERLREMSTAILDSPRARALGGATDERSRVLASFFREGRLTRLPVGEKRQLIILEAIAPRFESGRVYTEREVNEILKAVHDDYTTIRRMLVDHLFLNRHEGVYWVGEGRRPPETD
jgi:DNA-binding transcriptional ArsR family regulator